MCWSSKPARGKHFSLTLVCRLAVGPSQLSNALRTAGSFPGGKAAVIRTITSFKYMGSSARSYKPTPLRTCSLRGNYT